MQPWKQEMKDKKHTKGISKYLWGISKISKMRPPARPCPSPAQARGRAVPGLGRAWAGAAAASYLVYFLCIYDILDISWNLDVFIYIFGFGGGEYVFCIFLVYSRQMRGTLKRPGCSSWWFPTVMVLGSLARSKVLTPHGVKRAIFTELASLNGFSYNLTLFATCWRNQRHFNTSIAISVKWSSRT